MGRRSFGLVVVAGPVLALLAVWAPVLSHYHVPTPAIDRALLDRFRSTPSDAVLDRLDAMRFGTIALEASESGAAADEILAGTYRTRTGETIAIGLEDAPGSAVGSPMAQLQVAMLTQAQVLLDAHAATGDEPYFDAALRSVLAWARFERGSWLPSGFLWNDHAVASRVVVLANLWRAYRHRDDFDPAIARELLQFVARSAEMLAKPSHYTVRTNHGIMQDLALLHVAAAFPGLPGTEGDEALAADRLASQLRHYVSPDGVVLEHSAGYQDFAIRLLRFAAGYAEILALPEPDGLRARLAAAECFRRHYTRPDGTVPAYGDTFSPRPEPLEAQSGVPACPDRGDTLIDPEFGYASLRKFSGGEGQLFVAWADFASGAHKHDDELAAWLWLEDQDWWAGSGYWPYGNPDRKAAVSWRGANAPHGAGEAALVTDESRLLGVQLTPPVAFLDLERHAADGRAFRRQIAGLGADGIVVLDSMSGAAQGALETVWTLVPGIGLRESPPGSTGFEVIDPASGRALRAWFAGTEGSTLERLRGSHAPFGGLVASDGTIRPSEALVTGAPAGGFLVAIWQRAATAGTVPPSVRWQGPEDWSLGVPMAGAIFSVGRQGDQLEFATPDGATGHVAIRSVPAGPRPLLDEATARYVEAARQYPVFRDYFKYRLRATAAILALGGAGIVAWWLLRRRAPRSGAAVAIVTWVTAAWWLYYHYLV